MYNNNMYLDNDCILVCFKPLDPLTSFLNSEGRMIYRVLADGNCMFHALSHQLFGSPNKDFDVRSLLVRFESKNRSIFSSLLTSLNEPDINSHIRKMLAPGVWGTHVELVAAATYFQIPVYILKNNRCSWEVLFPLGPQRKFKYQLCPEIDVEADNFHRPHHIELLHSDNCHYDSLISNSGGPSTSPPKIPETHIDCTHFNLD